MLNCLSHGKLNISIEWCISIVNVTNWFLNPARVNYHMTNLLRNVNKATSTGNMFSTDVIIDRNTNGSIDYIYILTSRREKSWHLFYLTKILLKPVSFWQCKNWCFKWNFGNYCIIYMYVMWIGIIYVWGTRLVRITCLLQFIVGMRSMEFCMGSFYWQVNIVWLSKRGFFEFWTSKLLPPMVELSLSMEHTHDWLFFSHTSK